jgi:flagellar M-ring protein FliF
MQRIEQLVRTAVGFNQERGDQVSVINVRFPTPVDNGGVEAASPLMGFDKNDIMRAAEVGVLAIVGLLILFFVAMPLVRGAVGGGKGKGGTQLITTADGQTLQVQGGDAFLALPQPPSEIDQRLNMAQIEGNVKVSSVKRVAEFVDKHPDESVSILRGWLHESA